jgi:hypothetical protein
MVGFKRLCSQYWCRAGFKLSEGKSPMSFEVYHAMSEGSRSRRTRNSEGSQVLLQPKQFDGVQSNDPYLPRCPFFATMVDLRAASFQLPTTREPIRSQNCDRTGEERQNSLSNTTRSNNHPYEGNSFLNYAVNVRMVCLYGKFGGFKRVRDKHGQPRADCSCLSHLHRLCKGKAHPESSQAPAK